MIDKRALKKTLVTMAGIITAAALSAGTGIGMAMVLDHGYKRTFFGLVAALLLVFFLGMGASIYRIETKFPE